MDIKKKKFKNNLLKFEKILIIYITPSNQYWSINIEGVKKCVFKKIIDIKLLEDFLKKKKIISYENSKLFKKGVKFNFVLKGIELILNNGAMIFIENLNKKSEVIGINKGCSNLGQYFTVSKILKKIIFLLIKNNPDVILEPAVGMGHLVDYISKKMNCKFDNFEIDFSLNFLIDKSTINFTDFLLVSIPKKYKTIIGNPPYSIYGSINIYIKFIEKCFNLLTNKGELIFIVPSNFFRISTAKKLRDLMLLNGNFTHIYFFKNENLFIDANISVLIFRYVKTFKLNKITLVNNISKKLINKNGYIYFMDLNTDKCNYISDFFSLHTGYASGCDSIFKNKKLGNTQVLYNEGKFENCIIIEKFPTISIEVNNYLKENKIKLISRKGRKFNKSNWFQWNALRNVSIINQNFGKPCIYIKILTRELKIAFLGKVGYFSGSLIMLLPKKKNFDLIYYVNFLNSVEVRNIIKYSNRVSINLSYIANLPIKIIK